MFPIFIAILTGASIICLGGALLAARAARAARIAARIGGAAAVDAASAGGGNFVAALDRIGNMASAGKASHSLKQDLANAGFHSPNAAAAFVGAKILLLVFGLAAGALTGVLLNSAPRSILMLSMLPGGVLFFVPNLVVDVRRSQRRTEIRQHLADAIDLLEISVAAGMGLDTAWNAVADEVRNVCDPLADEMALTNLEIHLSTSRAVAMRHMAERTGAEELSSLVAVMVQSERFGTSMTDALRSFAQTMRETRSNRAQEIAEKMAVKLIFPMLVFLFPAVVMVVAGPAFMALKKALSGVAHG